MAAVDFDDKFLVTGHEDSTVGVWDNRVRKKNEEPIPHRLLACLVLRLLNHKIVSKQKQIIALEFHIILFALKVDTNIIRA